MQLIDMFRAIKHAQRKAPVDVEGVAQALGVRVNRAFLPKGISGELVRLDEGEYQINVNVRNVSTRQRFTIAHELGHFFFHRHLIGEGLDDDRVYRSTDIGNYYNRSIGPDQETEANRFAASLLMPDHLLESLEKEGLPRKEKARRLGVSEHALAIRLGESFP